MVLQRAAGRAAREGRRFRRRIAPTPLEQMLDSRWSFVRSSAQALQIVLAQSDCGTHALRQALDEAHRVREEIQRASIKGESTFGVEFDLERQSSLFLYAYCRLKRPAAVVETGIARGMSTAMILSALAANGKGRLTSFDITEDVGHLVDVRLRGRWDKIVLPSDPPQARLQLAKALAELPKIDLFLHDSDHSSAHQIFEFELAFQRFTPEGVLLSDDVEGTGAFDLATPPGWRLLALADSRKCLGVAYRGEPQP